MNWTMRRTFLVLVGLALAIAALTGCSSGGDSSGTGDGASEPATETSSMKLATVQEWAISRHALVVTGAATEDGCKNCHDGLTFTQTGGGFVPRRTAATGSVEPTGTDASTAGLDESGEESVRDFTVATDCRACHMGAGADIADAGTVDQIPSIDSAAGGLGAVCMACHNGWHAAGKNAQGEPSAPHVSVQTDMLYAVNTVALPGESTATAGDMQSPHLKVQDTCVGCHVTGADSASPNHTFRLEDYKGCERTDCHSSDMSQGGTAKEDFDGDGTKEKVAEEIKGLSETLKAAIEAKAGKFESSHGQVVMASGDKPDDATYAAAYNYFYVQKDGSAGIHNAAFTVDLLTRSIQAVGGKVGSTPSTTTP